MKTGIFTIAFIFLCAVLELHAQGVGQRYAAEANRQVYVEAGGPGVILSVNYDQRFTPGVKTGLGFRIGLGYSVRTREYYYDGGSYDESTRSYVTIPLGLNYVFGKSASNNAFEVGAGVTVLTRKAGLYRYDTDSGTGHLIGHATFMYRRVPIGGGFTWRIGFMSAIGTSGDIFPTGAVGFGYAF